LISHIGEIYSTSIRACNEFVDTCGYYCKELHKKTGRLSSAIAEKGQILRWAFLRWHSTERPVIRWIGRSC